MTKYRIVTKTGGQPFYFPLRITHSKETPPTEEHSHDCLEIGFIIGGSATHTWNGEIWKLSAGDVIILQTDQVHAYPETEHLEIYNILLEAKKLNIPQQDLVKFPLFQEIFIPENDEIDFVGCRIVHLPQKEFRHIKRLLLMMRTEIEEVGRSGYRSAMLGLFMNLLCHLLRACYPGKELPEKNDYESKIDAVVRYLKLHYLDPFDLNHLLRMSSMSRSNFMKQFRAVTGEAPRQFVIRKRIAHAAKLIAENTLSFSQIAVECGFNDSSHFYKIFRKITNETPRSYQQRITKHSDRDCSFPPQFTENPFITVKMN